MSNANPAPNTGRSEETTPSSGAAHASNGASLPSEAKVITGLLAEAGVTDYEPRVINQLLEFAYKHVADVLDDARLYSEHAGKSSIDKEDVTLAVQMKAETSFSQPPPRELMAELSRERNAQPLPPLRPGASGLKLPPDRYCLLQANYRLKASSARQVLIATPRFRPVAHVQTTAAAGSMGLGHPSQQQHQQQQHFMTPSSTSAYRQIAPGGPSIRPSLAGSPYPGTIMTGPSQQQQAPMAYHHRQPTPLQKPIQPQQPPRPSGSTGSPMPAGTTPARQVPAAPVGTTPATGGAGGRSLFRIVAGDSVDTGGANAPTRKRKFQIANPDDKDFDEDYDAM